LVQLSIPKASSGDATASVDLSRGAPGARWKTRRSFTERKEWL